MGAEAAAARAEIFARLGDGPGGNAYRDGFGGDVEEAHHLAGLLAFVVEGFSDDGHEIADIPGLVMRELGQRDAEDGE